MSNLVQFMWALDPRFLLPVFASQILYSLCLASSLCLIVMQKLEARTVGLKPI